jgi:O-antigen biosynthesis protein
MLAREALECTGVEIDEQTVKHAAAKYRMENLTYIHGSILDIPIKDDSVFDVAICFEAIEHIQEQDKVLSEVKRVLKKDGIFIVSSPDKEVASWPYPYHVKELTFEEFKVLVLSHFKQVTFFRQRVYTGSNIWQIPSQNQSRFEEFIVKKGVQEFILDNKNNVIPNYNIAIASQSDQGLSSTGVSSWLVG